jgi:hypothetical protein
MTFKELRKIVGAGRRRTGLYISETLSGEINFSLRVNGEDVKTVILDHDVASFYGGRSGETAILRYLREPFAEVEVVEKKNEGSVASEIQ